MKQIKVLSELSGNELEMAVNRAIREIENCFTAVTNVETFHEDDGITAVIHYDTEYYTI